MIESTAFRSVGVTRSPTRVMSTRQLGAKHSITKRFTPRTRREVHLAIMARPRRVKAYRAVYSCLVARGLVGRSAKNCGPVRSWLKSSGCVRVFQSCDRRTTDDPPTRPGALPGICGGVRPPRSRAGPRSVTVRKAVSRRESAGSRPESSVYDTTGVAIRRRLGHAPSIRRMRFARVWAVEEWRRILRGRRLGR
jgi:hypothetical protein